MTIYRPDAIPVTAAQLTTNRVEQWRVTARCTKQSTMNINLIKEEWTTQCLLLNY